MNVNSGSPKSVPAKRIRRTPEAAKALILRTAASRLKDQGLEGLNLTGVAEDAGMSHATIIHHFGSSEEMRRALVRHMTAALLTDVITALQQAVASVDLCQNLFRAINENGHAQLLAWLAVDNDNTMASPGEDIQSLFAAIIQTVASDLAAPASPDGPVDAPLPATTPSPAQLVQARNIVMLVASTALGVGIAGADLGVLLGMSDDEQNAFPRWLGQLVDGAATQPPEL